ncbi:glycerophosphodiester phosphodiesterase [Niveibacterium terrae]|uniref:glycerophosphodiester phosphodiesterase n=1 Tax=Niveibacterium terrae TaxID=3373598 RepID=UPI003A9097AB
MKRPWPLPPLVTHRCGGTLAPENTLIALEFALAEGCTAVEFDVMLSGSGTAVLIHDETLERTTDGVGRVCETSDEVLLRLDAGAWRAERFAGERIPLFSDAIRRCQALGIVIDIEIKPAEGFAIETATVAASMAAEAWPAGAARLPLISSFSREALCVAARLAPHLPRAPLFEDIPEDWESTLVALDAVGLICDGSRLREADARAIKASGYGLAVYTENDAEHGRRLRALGVDTLITDRPDLLADV